MTGPAVLRQGCPCNHMLTRAAWACQADSLHKKSAVGMRRVGSAKRTQVELPCRLRCPGGAPRHLAAPECLEREQQRWGPPR